MMTFLEFYENYLYHNTNVVGLLGINYTKSLINAYSSTFKDVINWDTIYNDWHGVKSKGYVSFTRDKSNWFAPGIWEPIRLTFDRTKLEHRHKIIPHVNTKSSDYAKRSGRFRYESEEKIESPIPLSDGCIKIEIPASARKQLEQLHQQQLSKDKQIDTFFQKLIKITLSNPLNTEISDAEFKSVLPPEPTYSQRLLMPKGDPKSNPFGICHGCGNENWECTCS